MKRRNFMLGLITFAIAGGTWFGYREYSRKVEDLSGVKPYLTMEAGALITTFEQDEAAANVRYLDKVIAVKGNVRTIEKDDRGDYSIVLGEAGSMSSVRCSMDSLHIRDIANVKEGIIITVKGACTGFNADELLGSDVILNRCVIENAE